MEAVLLYFYVRKVPFIVMEETHSKEGRPVKSLQQCYRQKLMVTDTTMVAVGIARTGQTCQTFEIGDHFSLMVRCAFVFTFQLSYKLFKSRDHVLIFFSVYQNFQVIRCV